MLVNAAFIDFLTLLKIPGPPNCPDDLSASERAASLLQNRNTEEAYFGISRSLFPEFTDFYG